MCVCVYKTESLCCIPVTNTVNQLFNFLKDPRLKKSVKVTFTRFKEKMLSGRSQSQNNIH